MLKSHHKFIVFLWGIAAGLILLEVLLRIIGCVHLHNRLGDKTINRGEDTATILCVGDSFTVGFGAKKEYSYPRQLESIFNIDRGDTGIKVINGGMATDNSAMILSKFEGYITDTNPDLVILLAGGANYWNAYGYRNYLNKRTLSSRLQDFLYNIKLFKLIRLVILDMENLKYRKAESPGVADWVTKALDCEWQGKYEEAIAWHKKIIEKSPASASSYHAIGRIYRVHGKRQKAKEFFKKAIEINPKRTASLLAFANNFVRDPARDREDMQFLEKYKDQNPVVYDIFEKISDREKYNQRIKEWVRQDVAHMIQICQRKKIVVVLQNYPNPQNLKYISDINMILKETAREYAVPFVDNSQVFQELSARGENEEDYFSADKTHCNEKGYKVMAENIYNCILVNKDN